MLIIHSNAPSIFITGASIHNAKNEDIKDIERSIQKIKDLVICGFHSMPYNKLTKLVTKSLVQDMVTCLNMIPSKNGISNNLKPEAIILGSPNLDYNKLRITFGSYAQVQIVTTNKTKQIIVGEIALLSVNNGLGITLSLPGRDTIVT